MAQLLLDTVDYRLDGLRPNGFGEVLTAENPAKFFKRYVAAADLERQDRFTIARVTMEEMITHDNKGRSIKPVMVGEDDQGWC